MRDAILRTWGGVIARFVDLPTTCRCFGSVGNSAVKWRYRANRERETVTNEGVSPMPLERQTAANGKCRAATKAGRQCAAPVVRGGVHCSLHADPERAAKLGRTGGLRNRKVYEVGDQEVSVPASVGEVKKILAQTMADVRAGKMDPKLGATLAYIATALLRAYEAEPPVPPERPSIYRALQFRTALREKELGYEILDINTGLPAARDTMANGTRSGAVVQRDKELRGAETETAPAQTAKAEVVQGKKDQEFEIFDLS
jgi:hypothetical protein